MIENDFATESKIEEIPTVSIAVGETSGVSAGTRVVVNHNASDPNQHTIGAITGLRTELDAIEGLKPVYSNKIGVANYYTCIDGQYDDYGYFVSLVSADSVKKCNGNNNDAIFGVTVDSAAFIGGQVNGTTTNPIIDNSKVLVATDGLVTVRCESDVAVGDFVVSNVDGIARKTETVSGYKVAAINTSNDNITYASIMLGVQADVTDKISASVTDLDSRLQAAETTVLSAINLADRAIRELEDIDTSKLVTSDKIEAIEGAANDAVAKADGALSDAINASILATQAKEIANSAITSAEGAKNEAIKEANKALEESQALRAELSNTAQAMQGNLDNTVLKFNSLADKLTPLAEWGDGKGIAGFVARADEDAATLASVTKLEGNFGTAIAGFVSNATSENSEIQALAEYNGKTAGLIADVKGTKAEIELIAKGEGSIAGLKNLVDETKAQTEIVSQKIESRYEKVKSFDKADETRHNVIYYAEDTKKYHYWEHNEWKDTTDPSTAGLAVALAGVKVKSDENSSSIGSLTAWQGTTKNTMARLEQKADENGAYIQSTVANMDKYAVGPHSQAYGFTLEQAANILEEGMMYVPIENTTETYNYTENEEKKTYTQEFLESYIYRWSNIEGAYKWIPVDKNYTEGETNTSGPSVYFTAEAPDTVDTTHGYWYKTSAKDADGNVIVSEYEPYVLYKWMEYKTTDEEGKETTGDCWTPVATLAGNSNNRAVSQIRQDADRIEAAITTIDGKYAGTHAFIDKNKSVLQDIVSWKGENGESLATFASQAGDNFASSSQIAQVTDEDGNVTVASIVTAINNDESNVTIDASHIILGAEYVTIGDLSGEGTTEINGANITTGKIDAERIDVDDLNAFGATIGGWTIDDDEIKNESGSVGMCSSDKYNLPDISDSPIRYYAGLQFNETTKTENHTTSVSVGADGSFSGSIMPRDDISFVSSVEALYCERFIENIDMLTQKLVPQQWITVKKDVSKYLYSGENIDRASASVYIDGEHTGNYAMSVNQDGTVSLDVHTDIKEEKVANIYISVVATSHVQKFKYSINNTTKSIDISGLAAIKQESIFIHTGITYTVRTPADTSFAICDDGTLYASNAKITGEIHATDGSFSGMIEANEGYIGGWDIVENGIYKSDVYGMSSGMCTSDDIEQVSKDDGVIYSLNDDESGYVVTGYNGSGANVSIRAIYNNLPVLSIGERAFDQCDSLISVTIPNSVSTISDRAVYVCKNLKNISIGGGVQSIGTSAFYRCESLTSVVIPNSVTSIGKSAFEYCTSLERVFIPRSVTSIDAYAFWNCGNPIIYCEADSKPEGWNDKWVNTSTVEFGYDYNSVNAINSNPRFFAGSTSTIPQFISDAKFLVLENGAMYASDADITGRIVASSGRIGYQDDVNSGWEIGPNKISGGGVSLYTGSNYIEDYGVDGQKEVRISVGDSDNLSSNPFRVFHDGYIVSSNGRIGSCSFHDIRLPVVGEDLEDIRGHGVDVSYEGSPIATRKITLNYKVRYSPDGLYSTRSFEPHRYEAISPGSPEESNSYYWYWALTNSSLSEPSTWESDLTDAFSAMDISTFATTPHLWFKCALVKVYADSAYGDILETTLGEAIYYIGDFSAYATTLDFGSGSLRIGDGIIARNVSSIQFEDNNGRFGGTWYASDGKIVSSWRGAKNNIEELDDRYSMLFDELRPVRFKYNDGQSKRYHTGLILDELKTAMDKANVDTSELAAYCVSDESTGEGGIRYGEFISLCIHEIQKLKKRVEELEEKLNTQQND